MTETHRTKVLTEKEEIERKLRGYENMQSWMLESDEKEEKRRLEARLKELS